MTVRAMAQTPGYRVHYHVLSSSVQAKIAVLQPKSQAPERIKMEDAPKRKAEARQPSASKVSRSTDETVEEVLRQLSQRICLPPNPKMQKTAENTDVMLGKILAIVEDNSRRIKSIETKVESLLSSSKPPPKPPTPRLDFLSLMTSTLAPAASHFPQRTQAAPSRPAGASGLPPSHKSS